MKNNIFYPIATSAMLTFIGFLLHIIGFDFKGLVSCYDTFSYYKEIIFVALSFIIIISVIVYDCLKNKLEKDKQQLKDIKDKKKELTDEVNYLRNEIDSLKGQLNEANENLTISKQKLNEMIEIDKNLRAQRALKNLRDGNK